MLLAALGALSLCGCEGSFLDPVGPVSEDQRRIFLDALTIMLCIVIPVIIATLAFAWWFRASNDRAVYLPNWTFSGRIEILVWSIPALVVFFLGGIAWIGSHELDPARPLASKQSPLEIDVVSLDWKWLFIYPEQHVASVNQLIIPTGVPLHFRLTSATVWNVFWVPQLGSMLYCMNGMSSTLYLQADKPGTYQGMSAMISGRGFATMHFETTAMAPEEFNSWATQARNVGTDLDTQSYRELLRPSESVPPYSYRSVEPGLFDAIVLQKVPSP